MIELACWIVGGALLFACFALWLLSGIFKDTDDENNKGNFWK